MSLPSDPGTEHWGYKLHNLFNGFVHGLVECRVEMECTFEILNLRKFPLAVGTNNNVCTQIVCKVPVSIVKITLQEDHRSRRFLIRKDLLE